MFFTVCEAKGLRGLSMNGSSDVYCKLSYGREEAVSTCQKNEFMSVAQLEDGLESRGQNKVEWQETFAFPYFGLAKINAEVWSTSGGISDALHGIVELSLDALTIGDTMEAWCVLHPPRTQRYADLQSRGELLLKMCCIEAPEYRNKVVEVTIHGARRLQASDWGITGSLSDPYVVVSCGRLPSCRSQVVEQELNPVWNEFHVIPYQPPNPLKVAVLDFDGQTSIGAFFGDDLLGEVVFPTRGMVEEETVTGWFPLSKGRNSSATDYGEVELSYTLRDGTRFKDTKLRVTVVQARGLLDMYIEGSNKPFCEVVHAKQVGRTPVANTTTPQWDKSFMLDYHFASPVLVKVIDSEVGGWWCASFRYTAQVAIPVNKLTLNEPSQQWYTLCDEHGREDTDLGEVEVQVEWISLTDNVSTLQKSASAATTSATEVETNGHINAVHTIGQVGNFDARK